MPRPPGSYNLKESARQKAVRLLAEGKSKDEIKQTLIDEGSKATTARQYLIYASLQMKGPKTNEQGEAA